MRRKKNMVAKEKTPGGTDQPHIESHVAFIHVLKSWKNIESYIKHSALTSNELLQKQLQIHSMQIQQYKKDMYLGNT